MKQKNDNIENLINFTNLNDISTIQLEHLAKNYCIKFFSSYESISISDHVIKSNYQSAKNTKNHAMQSDFELNLEISNEFLLNFTFEVKKIFEPRMVKKAIEQYKKIIDNEELEYSTYLVFVAPFISDNVKQMIIEMKCGYIDLSGNCYISKFPIHIEIFGNKNKFTENKSRKYYFKQSSIAANNVFFTMLNYPKAYWEVQELALKSNVSLGTAHNIKSFLLENNYLKEKNKKFKIRNINEFLKDWSALYDNSGSINFYFFSIDSIDVLEKKIISYFNDIIIDNNQSFPYALSEFSAAKYYKENVRHTVASAYVDSQFIQDLADKLNLQPTQQGYNVVLSTFVSEENKHYISKKGTALITSAAKTILDVYIKPNRGEEAATAIYNTVFKEIDNE